MYKIRNSIKIVEGINGSIFYDKEREVFLDLNAQTAIEVKDILSNSEKNKELAKWLEANGWIIEVEKKYRYQEDNSYRFSASRVSASDFRLKKILIELSTECGLDCTFCDSEEENTDIPCICKRWRYKKKKQNYKHISESALRFGVDKIIIIGGDVFFDAFEDFVELYGCLEEYNYRGEIVIVSNLTHIDEVIIDYIAECKSVRINAVLFGTDDDSYEHITRRKHMFSRVRENVQKLVERGVVVNGIYISMESDDKGVIAEKLKDLRINIGFKDHYRQELRNTQLLNDENKRIISCDAATFCALEHINICLYGQIFISAENRVYPCPYLREALLGDLSMEELQEVFNRDNYKEYWYLSKSKMKRCRKCKYRNNCMDCRAIEYNVTKDLYDTAYCRLILEGEIDEH